jgi:hypothetical protein
LSSSSCCCSAARTSLAADLSSASLPRNSFNSGAVRLTLLLSLFFSCRI